MKQVVVLGASKNPERYSNKAIKMLKTHGYEPVPVHPTDSIIEGYSVRKNLSAIEPGTVHAVTVYLNQTRSTPLATELIKLSPTYVIFNPGAENPELDQLLQKMGIKTENACTLVLLSTDQFPE